jgi:CheY-like chemotaxis protein
MTVRATLARRVLVVEDNEQARFALRLLLERDGHAVEEAEDGLEGVRKALASRPDVLFVDLDMPMLDGYGLARRVREALGGGVRLVALSGLDVPGRALAAGFDAHLLKPADPEQVCRCVQGGV